MQYYCLACACILNEQNWRPYNKAKKYYRCDSCIKAKTKRKFLSLNKIKKENCRKCDSKLDHQNKANTIEYICKDCKRTEYKNYLLKTKYNIVKNNKIKNNILDLYGNICACCGEGGKMFLTLDHVKNDGAEERRNGITKKHILEMGYRPDKYQTLCMNCNATKGHHGFCPHILNNKDNLCSICNIQLSKNNMFNFNIYGKHSICRNCVVDKAIDIKKHKNQYRVLNRKSSNLNVKLKAIKGYSGKCVCCGEMEPYFLTIDHVMGGGRKHVSKLGLRGVDFYRWLKKQSFPKEYRLLCYNCNCADGTYGYCSHNSNLLVNIVA